MCGAEYYVISDSAMKIIKSCAESSVEFLPVKIVSLDIKAPLGQYWIMNTLNNIDALNWEQTIWSTSEVPYGDEWASFIKPAFNLAQIKNQHIFLLRVGKHIRSGIYVSETLRYNLNRNKAVLGMDFMPIKVV
jgi:hypothetical protein